MKNTRSRISSLVLILCLGLTSSVFGTKTYYSVANGPASGAVWSLLPNGTPGFILGDGNLQNIVIQHGFVIQQDMDMRLNDVSIQSSGSLVQQGSYSITATGNWHNDGTFAMGTGKVIFDGESAQTLSGQAETTFYNLEFSCKVSVTVSSTIHLTNILDVTEGNVVANGNINFRSTASGTGMLHTLNGQLYGSVRVERYHDAQAQDWVMLASPMQNGHISQWNDNIITTGFTGSDYPTYNFNNILTYDETVAGTDDDGFVGVTDVNDPIENGKGYFVYTQAGDFTIDVIGKLKSGNVSFPITYTPTGTAGHDGWNLVANPYQCTIDWDATGSWMRTGINNAIHVYDAANGVYATYINGVGNNGGTAEIAPGQAFWVQANAANPTLGCNEGVKIPTQAAFKDNTEPNVFQIDLAVNGNVDQVTLVQNPDATEEFDVEYDGGKLIASDGSPAIYSKSSDDFDLAINALPSALEELSIPIYVEGPAGEEYTIEWGASEQFYAGSCLNLIDQLTNESHAIDVAGEITFAHDPLFSGPRFTIEVGQTAIPNVADVTCFAAEDGSITIAPLAMTDVLVLNSAGESILNVVLDNEEYELTDLASGLYTVHMSAHDNCEDMSINVWVDFPAPIVAEFETQANVFALVNGQAHVEFENLSEGAEHFDWSFGDNSLNSSVENPTHTFNEAGIFEVSLTASDDNCESSISKTITIVEDHATSIDGMQEANEVAAWMSAEGLHVQFDLASPSTYQIEAYSVLGQMLIEPVQNQFEKEHLILPCEASHALVVVHDMTTNERFTIQVIY